MEQSAVCGKILKTRYQQTLKTLGGSEEEGQEHQSLRATHRLLGGRSGGAIDCDAIMVKEVIIHFLTLPLNMENSGRKENDTIHSFRSQICYKAVQLSVSFFSIFLG